MFRIALMVTVAVVLAGARPQEDDTLDNGCPADWYVHRVFPHETESGKFYYCVRGERILRECQSGTHFNVKQEVCDWHSGFGVENSGQGRDNKNSRDNSGHNNNGIGNTGDNNNGNYNSGNGNRGDYNVGDGNTGDYNGGNNNIGNRNRGNDNVGDNNSGSGNKGDGNSGDRNIGNGNTGNDNVGDNNCGNGHIGNGDCVNTHIRDNNSRVLTLTVANKEDQATNALGLMQ